MNKWVGWILLAASLFVTYQGWKNSQPARDTQDMSRRSACGDREGCTVEAEHPRSVRTDFLARDYEWTTSTGTVTIRCQRAYIFAGVWACQATS